VRDLAFVCCTRGRKEATDLHRSLTALGTGGVTFVENNRVGLSARYNAVLDANRDADRILVFVHDDVVLDDPAAREKLNAAVDGGAAVVGLAGTAAFRISRLDPVTMWLQRRPPHPDLSGRVRHRFPDGRVGMSVYGPVGNRCVVMDGLFLAVHPRRLGAVRFDEQFAFHFYDLDFCLAVNQAGLVLATAGIGAIHASGGNYGSEAFLDAQSRFRDKWGEGDFFRGKRGRLILSRNDPCYCGSGLRYKHCHGKA
jgi:hypothetical protein